MVGYWIKECSGNSKRKLGLHTKTTHDIIVVQFLLNFLISEETWDNMILWRNQLRNSEAASSR